jgi:hypothetical protein
MVHLHRDGAGHSRGRRGRARHGREAPCPCQVWQRALEPRVVREEAPASRVAQLKAPELVVY